MHFIRLAEPVPVDTLLFPGTTEAKADPADSFPERLRKALIRTIVRKRWSGLVLQLRLMVYETLREDLQADLIVAAQELVANSIDHGLYQRSFGRISLSLHGNPSGALLEVIDNGWGVGTAPIHGTGSGLLHSLGAYSLANVVDSGRTNGAVARLLILRAPLGRRP